MLMLVKLTKAGLLIYMKALQNVIFAHKGHRNMQDCQVISLFF